MDLLNRFELANIYLDLAQVYGAKDDPDFVKALASLIKVNHIISFEDDFWLVHKEPLEIIRKNYESFLRDLSRRGYKNKEFYREAERAYEEFKSKIKPTLPDSAF